jgi:hypothetical protein
LFFKYFHQDSDFPGGWARTGHEGSGQEGNGQQGDIKRASGVLAMFPISGSIQWLYRCLPYDQSLSYTFLFCTFFHCVGNVSQCYRHIYSPLKVSRQSINNTHHAVPKRVLQKSYFWALMETSENLLFLSLPCPQVSELFCIFFFRQTAKSCPAQLRQTQGRGGEGGNWGRGTWSLAKLEKQAWPFLPFFQELSPDNYQIHSMMSPDNYQIHSVMSPDNYQIHSVMSPGNYQIHSVMSPGN